MTSPTTDVLDGIGQLINAAGVADYPWTDGSTQPAVVTFKDMPDSPDRVVVLTPYGASGDQPEITLGRQAVQVWCRGTADDSQDVDVLADAVFAVLHGITNRQFGSVHVVQGLRESGNLPRGMDEQRRWMRTDNYYFDVDLPTSANRPV